MHALLAHDCTDLQVQFALVAKALHLLGEQLLVLEVLQLVHS